MKSNPLESFIHYGDLYSAPSTLLLRSAPDPCMAKKKSFEETACRCPCGGEGSCGQGERGHIHMSQSWVSISHSELPHRHMRLGGEYSPSPSYNLTTNSQCTHYS